MEEGDHTCRHEGGLPIRPGELPKLHSLSKGAAKSSKLWGGTQAPCITNGTAAAPLIGGAPAERPPKPTGSGQEGVQAVLQAGRWGLRCWIQGGGLPQTPSMLREERAARGKASCRWDPAKVEQHLSSLWLPIVHSASSGRRQLQHFHVHICMAKM